jgi:hypothetical protein
MSCGQEYREYLYGALDLGLLEEKDLDSAINESSLGANQVR